MKNVALAGISDRAWHVELDHSHHHISPLLCFSRSLELAPGETGGCTWPIMVQVGN